MKYTDPKEIDDIQYVTYLLMARAGLRALEFYDPKAKKHLQAHMQVGLLIWKPLFRCVSYYLEMQFRTGTNGHHEFLYSRRQALPLT
jgi:dipeptidyl-peptidase III